MTGEPLREHARPLELRFAGNTLHAELRYGERARDRAERFAPGSIILEERVSLNLQHDPAIVLADTDAGTLRFTDTSEALRIEADLQGAALDLVRRGRLTGVSPEFRAHTEQRDAGVRILTKAAVDAFGLVNVSSYRTGAELRAEAEDADRMARLRRWALTG